MLSMIEFPILAKLLSAGWLLFLILLTNLFKNDMQNLVNYIKVLGKKYLPQLLDVPKNSCSKNSRETFLF